MLSFDKFSQSKFVVVFSCLKKPRVLQGFLFLVIRPIFFSFGGSPEWVLLAPHLENTCFRRANRPVRLSENLLPVQKPDWAAGANFPR